MSRRLFLLIFTTLWLFVASITKTIGETPKVGELRIKTDGGKVVVFNSGKSFTVAIVEAVPTKKSLDSLVVEVKIKINDLELENLSKHLISSGYSSVKFSK